MLLPDDSLCGPSHSSDLQEDINFIAKQTHGYTYVDLERLCDRARVVSRRSFCKTHFATLQAPPAFEMAYFREAVKCFVTNEEEDKQISGAASSTERAQYKAKVKRFNKLLAREVKEGDLRCPMCFYHNARRD